MNSTQLKFLCLSTSTFTLICLLLGCANAPMTAEKQTKPAISALRQIPVLMQGMTANMVRDKLGEPLEIKSMDSPVGKAEIWVYRIQNTVGVTQVASSTKDIPAFTVLPGKTDTVMVQTPVYTMQEEKMLITLSLLMYQGKLTARRAQAEKSLEFQ